MTAQDHSRKAKSQPVQPTQELHWVQPARQARTHESLERILIAAETLVGQKRFQDIHVAEVARLAGVSVASFYRRLKDKDALLHALHERICAEAIATADDALSEDRWRGAGINEILSTLFPFLVEAVQRHKGLDRAIYQRALSDDVMRERSSRLMRHVLAGLSKLLLERADEIQHPQPALAVSFALVQASGLLIQHYTAGMREFELVPMTDEQISRELVTSVLGYLGIRDTSALFRGNST
jgi:AcrR family transcriptional regulator